MYVVLWIRPPVLTPLTHRTLFYCLSVVSWGITWESRLRCEGPWVQVLGWLVCWLSLFVYKNSFVYILRNCPDIMSQCRCNFLSFTLAYLRLWRAVSGSLEFGMGSAGIVVCEWKGTLGAFVFWVLDAFPSIVSRPTNLWFTPLNSTISLFLDSGTITITLPRLHVHPIGEHFFQPLLFFLEIRWQILSRPLCFVLP